ncbi:hypothetical protein RAS2_17560 [Phycisphaerae bacterium RAS2]|nr:hypothetical protein RAS2_17560 [Phycisphaerae bacterium RAS2]
MRRTIRLGFACSVLLLLVAMLAFAMLSMFVDMKYDRVSGSAKWLVWGFAEGDALISLTELHKSQCKPTPKNWTLSVNLIQDLDRTRTSASTLADRTSPAFVARTNRAIVIKEKAKRALFDGTRHRSILGLYFAHSSYPYEQWLLRFPLWIPVFAMAIWLWIVYRRRTTSLNRYRQGLCLRCGYVLIEQQVRCPECGTKIPEEQRARLSLATEPTDA